MTSTALQLPQSRVRKIMKQDDDVILIASDAVAAVTRATELFLQQFAERAWEEAQAKKHKNIQYDDCARAVKHNDEFEFLADIIPERVPMKHAAEKKKALAQLGVTTTPSATTSATTISGEAPVLTTTAAATATTTAATGEEAQQDHESDDGRPSDLDD